MKYKILFFLLFTIIIHDSQSKNKNELEEGRITPSIKYEYKCKEKCESYYICDETLEKCVHKGFFPIFPLELFQIVFFIAMSMIATSVGVGGGVIYSSMLMFVENFAPFEAYPISTFIIAICSSCTFYMGVVDKQKNPGNSFVEWDLAIIFCPSLLLGTKIGAILNKSLSDIFLTVLLAGFVLQNMKKFYENAQKARAKELSESAPIEDSDPKYILMKDNIEHRRTDSKIRSPYSNKSKQIKSSRTDEVEREMVENSIKIGKEFLEEENNPLRWSRIKFLCIFLAINVIDQILEGNSRVPSLIGVQKCSGLFWLIFLMYCGLSIYLVQYSFQYVKTQHEYKMSLRSESKTKFGGVGKDLNKIIGLTFFGGIIAGMLGVGGGIICVPLLLSLGVDTKSTTSTSNLLIIFTAVSATGQLYLGFALCMAVPCGIASLYGSRLINDYINRTKRSSILLFFLFYTMIISFVVLMVTAYNRLQNSYSGLSILSSNSYCS